MNLDDFYEEQRRRADEMADRVRRTVEREERGPDPCTCNWCLIEWARK